LNPQFGLERMIMKAYKGLSQNVRNLLLSRHMTKANETIHEFMPDKVAIELNVFGALVKHGVLGNINRSLIVTPHRDGCEVSDCKLM